MKLVSRFESQLLRILQCFLRQVPLEQARPLLAGRWPAPPCLGQDALDLVQDHLAKGCTLLLARAGGWRRERFQRGDGVSEGRLWERTPPSELGLVFSRHTLRFLLWITANNPGDDKPKWTVPEDELTPGDWLLCYFAFGAVSDSEFARHLRGLPGFANNPLCLLAYPELVAGDGQTPAAYDVWMSGPGAFILEALQPELGQLWLQGERAKGSLIDWEVLRTQSRSREQVLEAFLTAVERAGRLDLARFLLHTAAQLLTPAATARQWVHATAGVGTRLADRADTYRSALALVGRVERFQRWEQQARGVGYFDEGYAAGQLLKQDWERLGGDELAGQARRILRELDPMRLASEGRS